MNIGTIIDSAAIDDPDRVALIIGKDAIGYGQLAAAVQRCAAGLAATAAAYFPSHRCSRHRASVQRQR